MRIVLPVLIAATIAGCGDRRSFDERYSDSQEEIERRAERIDEELANEPETQRTDGSGEAGGS